MIPGKQYKPADLVAIARRRWWVVLLPLVVTTVGVAVATRYIPNRYRSETLILVVPQRVPESYVKSTVTSRIEDRLQSISQQILSRTRLERIITDLNLYTDVRRTDVMEDIVAAMRKDISVEVVKGDAFRITYTGEEPRAVMQATERLASLFIEENLRDRALLAENSYEFLDSQLVGARSRLLEYEKKLEEYRRRYAGELPSQLQANLQVIQNTQMQIQALTESTARDRDRRLVIERAIADLTPLEPLPPPPAAATPAEDAPAGDTLSQQLEAAQRALQQLELRLKPEHPDLIRMKKLVASLTEKVNSSETRPAADPARAAATQAQSAKQNRIRDLRAELENIDVQIARKESEEKRLRDVSRTYQVRAEAAPTRESELVELTRDYSTLQATYASLLAKKEDSKISANLEQRQIGEQFKMLDPARLPEKPYSPDRIRLNALGAALGLTIGLVIVGLLEFADTTLKSDDDVIATLKLPVLALVPRMVTANEQRQAQRRRLITALASSAAAVVAMAALAVWKLRP